MTEPMPKPMLDTTHVPTDSRAHADDLAVLLVDDEPELTEELALALTDAGFRCLMAESADEALRILAEAPDIGVVVTDVRMPGKDGFYLARTLVESGHPSVARRIVIMTGHATLNDAAAAVRAGAFDYLRKPFSLDQITTIVTAARDAAAADRLAWRHGLAERERLVRAEAETERLRLRDRVTGLPNGEALAQGLAGLEARDDALLMLRLEGMGLVAEAGSRGLLSGLITAAAERLEAQVGAGRLYALSEGADFAVLLPGWNAAEARGLAQSLLAGLVEPLAVDGQSVVLSAAIGIAARAEASGTPLDVCALVAMAAASRQGGARAVLFAPDMHAAAARRLRLAQDLPEAAAAGQLALAYQPLIRPDRGALLGFEALMRWTHPDLGIVSPAEFIAIAEETGSIIELGAFAIRTVGRQAAAWRAGGKTPYVSVNVSARQLRDADIPALFAETLAENGLPASALVVELTESLAIGSEATAMLAALRAQGLRVALDDFGAGFSSLGALRSVPVDIVKFDRALLPEENASWEREARFFAGLVQATRALDFAVVAEGIETEAQLALARDAGCFAIQGYLTGRPLPLVQAGTLIETWRQA